MLALQTKTDVVQSFIDFGLDWLGDHNYTLTADIDMAGWTRTMEAASAIAGVNPTFDPRYNRLSPGNSFWLDVRAGSHTVATSAARLFVTDDFLELVSSTRLWYDPPRPQDEPLALTPPFDMPTIHGQVGHEGGLWIHPEHRKRGMSVILPHLNRALCLREWGVHWQTGMTLRDIGRSGIASWAYGFPHVVPCFEGRLPLKDRDERLFITYMDRDELVSGLELETVSRLLPDRDNQPVHAPARIHKR
jgi:hypothetical protein